MKSQTKSLLATALLWVGTSEAQGKAAAKVSPQARSRRSLQNDTPAVGFSFSDTPIAFDSESVLEVTAALEQDPQVTAGETVELGGLVCSSLASAEDAPVLMFAISSTEIITAEQTSYLTLDGQFFDDGIGRKVWAGVITDPPQADDEASARIVSMAWADECSIETFILKVVTDFTDGSTSVLKSVPCELGSDNDLCLVTVMIDFLEETDPPAVVAAGDSGSALPEPTFRRLGNAEQGAGVEPVERHLQSGDELLSLSSSSDDSSDIPFSKISVMFLYTPEALEYLGDISVAQMVSFLMDGLVTANEALVNSKINAEFALVYMGMLPYTQEEGMYDALLSMTFNAEVRALRDLYEADLVQLVGAFDDFCGIAWLYNGQSEYGYSVAAPNCFYQFTHTHELGHNLGCYHNRDNSGVETDYAHGYRDCEEPITYRTIMSYQCSDAPRINYFSNPDVNYLTILPTGSITEDCSRAIEDNMGSVAAYRPIPPTPAPTPAPTRSPTPAPTRSPTPAPRIPEPTAPPTPVPTTIMPISGLPYMYLDCYTDVQSSRVLSGAFKKNDPVMTTEACAAFCDGFTYFGTQYGQECWCGISSDDPAEHGPATCDRECTGDASQICGGYNAINVYQNTNLSMSCGTHLGCYTDAKSDRIMTLQASQSNMSTELCCIFCTDSKFYGTQYGKECWCGGDSTVYDKHGASTGCTFECSGESSETCGGFNAMNVYEY